MLAEKHARSKQTSGRMRHWKVLQLGRLHSDTSRSCTLRHYSHTHGLASRALVSLRFRQVKFTNTTRAKLGDPKITELRRLVGPEPHLLQAALNSRSIAFFFSSKWAVFLSSFSITQFTSPPIRMANPVMYNQSIKITTAPKDP